MMTDPATALKPCPNPWCEASERSGDYRPQVQYSNFGLVYVACTSCNMAGPTRQHEIDAIAAWNTRKCCPKYERLVDTNYAYYCALEAYCDAYDAGTGTVHVNARVRAALAEGDK